MKLVELGSITRPHGYKGAFVVNSYAGRDSALGTSPTLYLGASASTATPHEVIEAAWMPSGWKIHVKGVDTEEAAKRVKGQQVFADRDALPAPETDEYYVMDLIGAKVIDADTGLEIGVFEGVEQGDTVGEWWAVRGPDRQYLIPPKKHFIEKVDVANKIITIRHLSELP